MDAKVGAGRVGCTSVPGTVFSSMQSIKPLFRGISGSMVDNRDPTTAALVQAIEQLMGAITCGWVSLKSAVIFRFVFVTVTRIGNGPLAPSVVLDHVLARRHTVGQLLETGHEAALRIVQGIAHAGSKPLQPIAVDEMPYAALGNDIGGDLRLDIAPKLIHHPHIAQQKPANILVDLSSVDQTDGGKDEPFLDHVLRGAGPAARGHPANVGPVTAIRGEAHAFSPIEDGPAHHAVGLVRSPVIGIVVQIHVAFGDGRLGLDHVTDRLPHRSGVHRDALVLGDHGAVAIEQGAGKVLSMTEAGGKRGPCRRQHHFAHGADQVRAHDLGREGIQRRFRAHTHDDASPPTDIERYPSRVIRPVDPSGI